jgi:hypothetical protein
VVGLFLAPESADALRDSCAQGFVTLAQERCQRSRPRRLRKTAHHHAGAIQLIQRNTHPTRMRLAREVGQ